MLKCDYKITNGGEQQDYFYQINNNIHSKKKKYWNKINGTNREMLYGVENYDHDSRFSDIEDFHAKVPDIFQSYCDVVNHHLQVCYNFDKKVNMYKYYLPNMIIHHGYVNCDQVPHLDYKHVKKEYKPKPGNLRKQKKEN